MTVEVGDAIPPFVMASVTPERMKTTAAILRDPTPIHWDRDATRDLGLEGRLLNQSPLNLGYVINMLIAWAGPECVRRIRTTFPLPVFDGERVTAGGVVREIVLEGDETIAVCDTWLDRDDGSRTVAATAWVVIADRLKD